MVTAVGRSVSAVVHSPLVQAHWRKVAVGVAAFVLFVIAAYVVTRRPSSQRKINPDELPPATIPWDTLSPAEALLQLQNTRSERRKSESPIKLGCNSYETWVYGIFEQYGCGLTSYVGSLLTYHIIINLRHPEESQENDYYLNKQEGATFEPEGSPAKGRQGYRADGKFITNFIEWKDGEALTGDALDHLIELAQHLAGMSMIPTQKGPFIHCSKSQNRTTTFLAMVQMIIWKQQLLFMKDSKPIEPRMMMGRILEAIARTGNGRVPTLAQLEMLMNKDFLERLKFGTSNLQKRIMVFKNDD